MMSTRSLLALLLASLLLPLAAWPHLIHGQALPVLPATRFYGTATINGLLPAAYATVTAESASGTICGNGAVTPGTGAYSVDIQPFGGCAGSISFLVGGQWADQTSYLANLLGGATLLNLTVTTLVPPPPAPLAVPPPPPPFTVPGPPPPPAPFGVTVSYAAGWALVAGPPGTVIPGISGPLYTFQPWDAAYEAVAAGSPLQSGSGYWAQFTSPVTVTLQFGSPTSVGRVVPPGQYALIGNPYAVPATVSGAGALYTYDPIRGYQPASVLQPGQGAWALSLSGSITIRASN